MPSDDEIREILENSTLSDWFTRALLSAIDRDPVDAANDAGLLAAVLDYRARRLAADALALASQAIRAASDPAG